MIELIHIGHTVKSRGINGSFRINIDSAFNKDLFGARAVFLNLDGARVPFLIEKVEQHNQVLLKLEEIDSPEDATPLLGKELYLEKTEVSKSSIESSGPTAHLYEGRTIINQDGNTIGRIEKIMEYPDQLLAQVLIKGKEVLIPIHQNLTISIDEQQIKMTIPEGLLDL